MPKDKQITSSIYEFTLFDEIATRACEMAKNHNNPYDKIDAMMDIQSAHEDCPLYLDKLRDADDFNFAHDIFGIRIHMDRSSFPGKIIDFFLPRFAISGKRRH